MRSLVAILLLDFVARVNAGKLDINGTSEWQDSIDKLVDKIVDELIDWALHAAIKEWPHHQASEDETTLAIAGNPSSRPSASIPRSSFLHAFAFVPPSFLGLHAPFRNSIVTQAHERWLRAARAKESSKEAAREVFEKREAAREASRELARQARRQAARDAQGEAIFGRDVYSQYQELSSSSSVPPSVPNLPFSPSLPPRDAEGEAMFGIDVYYQYRESLTKSQGNVSSDAVIQLREPSQSNVIDRSLVVSSKVPAPIRDSEISLGTQIGEVRFGWPNALRAARKSLEVDGSFVNGSVVRVTLDPKGSYVVTVLVTNLAPEVGWRDLRDAFEAYGKLRFAIINSDLPQTGLVRFDGTDAVEAAQKALTLNGSMIGESVINVTVQASSSDSADVVVSGLPGRMRWYELKKAFKPYGNVSYARVDKLEHDPSRTGEVQFEGPGALQAAQKSLELDGSLFGTKFVNVSIDPDGFLSSRIMVRGLPPTATSQDLINSFKAYGSIEFAGVAHRGFTESDRGTGFGAVRFGGATRAGALHAARQSLEMDGQMLGGSTIRVILDPYNKMKVLVRGLSCKAKWRDLKEAFEPYGLVLFAAVHGTRLASTSNAAASSSRTSRTAKIYSGKFPTHGNPITQRPLPPKLANVEMTGEVRFRGPGAAEAARNSLTLDGSMFGEKVVNVTLDPIRETHVLICGLSPDTTSQEIRDAFSLHGDVAFATVSKGGRKGRAQLRGDVRFEGHDAVEAARKACRLDGSRVIGGTILRVVLDPKDETKVMVSGIPPQVSWQELKKAFTPYGNVALASIGEAWRRGGLRVSGQVRFDGPYAMEAAQDALDMDGNMIGDSVVHVNLDPDCEQENCSVFVSGLPPEENSEELKDVFKPYGTVKSAKVSNTWYKGGPHSTGEVHFQGVGAVEAARKSLALDGSLFADGVIHVTLDMKNQTKVHVGGLPAETRVQELRDAFKAHGNVSFVHVFKGWRKGGPPGTGEVFFRGPGAREAAERSLALDGTMIGESIIHVTLDPNDFSGTKVLVSGLPSEETTKELRDAFQAYGDVSFTYVAKRKGGQNWRS